MDYINKIGTLAERLKNRVGREYGRCSTCGSPTRSHIVAGKRVCHTCHTSPDGVLLADGGWEDGDGSGVLPTIETCEEGIPSKFTSKDRWLNWLYAEGEQKRAVAYWERKSLKPVKGYKEKTASFEQARRFVDWEPYHVSRVSHDGWGNSVGLFFHLPEEPSRDGIVFVDLDNVRNPDTGALHPFAIELLDRSDTYAQVSTSGTGIHVFFEGRLPAGHTAVQSELEETDAFPGAEIEIYHKDRLVAMTGDRIEGSAETVNRGDDIVEELADEFGNDGHDGGKHKDEYHEPAASRNEIQEVDTTQYFQDVKDALYHTKPRDISMRSPKTEDRGDGEYSFDPTFADSESGTRLGADDEGFVYRAGNVHLSPLQVVALEEGIISTIGDYPSGEDFFEAVDALRDRGAQIPEYQREQMYFSNAAILPELEEPMFSTGITTSELRELTCDQMKRAIMDDDNVCVDAIMTAGKSYGAFKAVAELDRQASVFVARNDMKEQSKQYALENGIDEDDILVLPSITDDCPTWNGQHGETWQKRIQAQYAAGASPKAIHEMNDNIPCRGDHDHDDDGEALCEYEQKWQFDPDDYQVIIGHYKHAHVTHVTMGRVTIFDEAPVNQFTERLEGTRLVTAINTFLSQTVSPPVDDFDDLIRNRDDSETVTACSRWFSQMEQQDEIDLSSPDNSGVIRNVDETGAEYHAYAPHAVYAILNASPIADGSNFERCFMPGTMGGGLVFTTSEEHGDYYTEFRQSPSLDYAESVLALDGTPLVDESRNDPHKVREWEQALGVPMKHRRVMDDADRRDYIKHTLNHQYVSASEHVNPYSSGKYNDMAEDAALCSAVKEVYGGGTYAPLTFTPKAVSDRYDDAGFVEQGLVSGLDYPGNLRGSDRYGDERLLVILGSTHYGDHEIRRRAAWLRESVSVSGKGKDRDYGSDIGNAILEQMRENVTAQLAMRVGRDGGGATIVLKTTAIPDYFPIAGKGGVTKWPDGMKQVLEAWTDLGGGSAAFVEASEVAAHDAVTVSDRHVRTSLDTFAELGYLSKGDHPTDGRKNAYSDTGLSAVAAHDQAEVELPEIEWPDSIADESPESVRTNVYTSEFRFSSSIDSVPETATADSGSDGSPGENRGDDGSHGTAD